MTPDAIIKHYKTVPAAAKALDFTPAAIYKWKANGAIPYVSQELIESRSGGKFKAKKS